MEDAIANKLRLNWFWECSAQKFRDSSEASIHSIRVCWRKSNQNSYRSRHNVVKLWRQWKIYQDFRQWTKCPGFPHRLLRGPAVDAGPGGLFSYFSKNTGFDPLIRHLRTKTIRIYRGKNLAEIPILKISSATSNDEKISAIIKNLAGRGTSRPRKIMMLSNTINSLFKQKLSESELAALIKVLTDRKYIVVKKSNISY